MRQNRPRDTARGTLGDESGPDRGRGRSRAARILPLLVAGAVLPISITPSLAAGAARIGPPQLVEIGSAPAIPHGAVATGPSDRRAPLSLEFVLRPRHYAELGDLVNQVSNPSSPKYRRYLSAGEFASQFGAGPGTIRTVERAIRSLGLDPVGVDRNHLAIRVESTVARAEAALHTTIARLRLPDGTTGFANLVAPRLTASTASAVGGIVGLDTMPAFAPAGLRATTPMTGAITRTSARARGRSLFSCPRAGSVGLTANQIASAYGFDAVYGTGDLGQNTTVALIEFSRFSAFDISTFESCLAPGANPAITEAPVGGVAPATPSTSSSIEAELDIEQVIGLAPSAHVVVEEGHSEPDGSVTNADFLAALSQAITGAPGVPVARVISISFGSCEPIALQDPGFVQGENALLAEAALQGQTVVAAAGDAGSADCLDDFAPPQSGQLAVDDPASQPDVTAVGGTTLSLSPTRTEVTWNASGGAGGGGISAYWPMPSYQLSAAPALGVIGPYSSRGSCSSPSGHCRQVPDISANAGTPYAIYCTITACRAEGWTPIEGTSAAAPLIAALFGLADSSTGCAVKGPIGFANPALYAIASGPGYASAFTDITAGNNDLSATNGGVYPAGPGYDLATGLGSPFAGNSTSAGRLGGTDGDPTLTADGGPRGRPTYRDRRPRLFWRLPRHLRRPRGEGVRRPLGSPDHGRRAPGRRHRARRSVDTGRDKLALAD